jgi:hypothetical protein
LTEKDLLDVELDRKLLFFLDIDYIVLKVDRPLDFHIVEEFFLFIESQDHLIDDLGVTRGDDLMVFKAEIRVQHKSYFSIFNENIELFKIFLRMLIIEHHLNNVIISVLRVEPFQKLVRDLNILQHTVKENHIQ